MGNDSSGSTPSAKAQSRLKQISSHVSHSFSLSSADQPSADSRRTSSFENSSSSSSSRANEASSASSDSDSTKSSSPGSKPSEGRTRRNRKKSTSDAPPADYSDLLGQIKHLQEIARNPSPSHTGYQRQKAAGKLWVRERVDKLFDQGSVVEIGSVSGAVDWEQHSRSDGSITEKIKNFTPSNNVQGFAKLGGRKCCFTADDYSLRAGHADGALWSKTTYLEKLSLKLKLPIIKLVDGSSGGGSVTTIKKTGFSYVPPLNAFDTVVEQLNSGIPNLGAVLGPAIGLGAARVVSCHFSVMAGDIGSLFNAGPKVVAGATFEEGLTFTDLGGADMHCRNGTIDNLAANEEDAFDQMRQLLTYLPNSGSSLPPCLHDTGDRSDRQDEWLRTAIPRRKERMYNPRKVISTILDQGSFFEIGALWGTTTIVGVARMNGRPIGIIANNCESGAGALDAAGSAKLTKHLKFCDVMNLPIVQFVDVPGYAIGTVAERSATMRKGVELVMAYYTTTIPMFSVILRRVYGVAGGAMLDCRDPRMRVAWPSGDWGSLPLQGGIEVGHSAELKRAREQAEKAAMSEDEEERKAAGEKAAQELYADLERDYNRLMNPVRTANAFDIEEIIDPATTRPVVCQWVEHIYEHLLPERLLERANGKIRPVFA